MPPKRICSDTAPLNKREWSVSECYKRGVKSGFVAGLKKGRKQGVQRGRLNVAIEQAPRLIPQQNVFVQFDNEPDEVVVDEPILIAPPPVGAPPPQPQAPRQGGITKDDITVKVLDATVPNFREIIARERPTTSRKKPHAGGFYTNYSNILFNALARDILDNTPNLTAFETQKLNEVAGKLSRNEAREPLAEAIASIYNRM